MDKTIDKGGLERAVKIVQTLPDDVQFAIVSIVPNILNGAFWGFADLNEVKKHADSLRANPNIILRRIWGGCIVEVEPNYILSVLGGVDNAIVTPAIIEDMRKGIVDAGLALEKFLVKSSKSGGYSGSIGVYCINDVASIRLKGVPVPAFRLTLEGALRKLASAGYSVKVGDDFIPASEVLRTSTTVYQSLLLSPTRTGCFLEIRK